MSSHAALLWSRMENLSLLQFADALQGTGVACYNRRASTFTYLNKAFLSIVEKSAEQVMHRPSCLFTLFSEKDFDFVEKTYSNFLEKGQFSQVELNISFPGGHQKTVLCDSIELEDGNMLITFVRDITRRKSQEEYLIKHSAQKDMLLDMLTHNLSSLLFISKDILSILGKDLNTESAESHHLISLLHENTQQCIDILSDFLKREHFESTRLVVNIISFDVVEKINVVLDKLRQLYPGKTFILSCSQSTVIVNSDPVKFFQIIQNILSNAVKFTSPTGNVEVILEKRETHFIVVIKDNGIGLSKEVHPELFKEPLIGRHGVLGESSNGIGLYVTQRLVELLGGSITLMAGQFEGSSFRLEIPLSFKGLY